MMEPTHDLFAPLSFSFPTSFRSFFSSPSPPQPH